jgi:hypothetical protein
MEQKQRAKDEVEKTTAEVYGNLRILPIKY